MPQRLYVMTCLIAGTVMLLSSHKVQGQSPLEKGTYWYNHRADSSEGHIADPGPIAKAIKYLKIAVEEDPENAEACYGLLRSYHFEGQFVLLESDERVEYYTKHRILSASYARKFPNHAGILFEHVCIMGFWAKEVGVLRAGMDGILGKMKKTCENLLALDTNFRQGTAWQLMGILFVRTPYIPFILNWPDNKTGMMYFDKCLKNYPHSLANNFYYAEALKHLGKDDKAIQYLKKVIALEPRKGFIMEDRYFKEQSRLKLEKWD